MSVLKVEELRKSYKRGFIPKTYEVLKGVSFTLPASGVTGFLGGNGAGKTTTIKCLLGLAFPDSGKITFFNHEPLSEKVRSRIGFLPERPYFYEYLTGQEFLYFYGEISTKLKRKVLLDRIEALLKRVDLYHSRHKKLREYSKGMLQKVGVAQALIHDPEFVIFDEPMSGLDPDGRFYIAEIIRETAAEGRSVFFSSHLLPDAEALCERLVILKGGQVSFEGPMEEFLNKMGEASVVTYLQNGAKQDLRVQDAAELQKEIGRLLQQGAKIDAIRKDRNLEQAFIKMGLRD
jgi:ABC-2 type transport system ATP-binding protein